MSGLEVVREQIMIGGAWVAPATTATVAAVHAATEEIVGSVPAAGPADADAAVAAARQAFDGGVWPQLSPVERAAFVGRLLDELDARADAIARWISIENGQPVRGGRLLQVDKPLEAARATAELVHDWPVAVERRGMNGTGLLVRHPVGVAAAIVPWNAPLFLTLMKLVPALLAGCTVVVKAAPETPLDAYELADACVAAGFPPGVVSVLVGGPEAGAALVEHRGVDKIAFTGSTATGRSIMARCADRVTRLTLELGGKSAAILLDDVALPAVLPRLGLHMTLLSGQICVALTRVLVPRARHGEMVEALAAHIGSLKVGDPFDADTVMGPLVSSRQRDRVERYIGIGRDEGATVALGGGRPKGLDRGWYVEPTLFADVDNAATIAQEEIFGPVWCVIPYDGDDDAVRLANGSIYGLGGAVWSADADRAAAIARRVRAGVVGVNGWTNDPLLPSGGFRQSGLGREQGLEGLDSYVEQQVIIDCTSPPAGAPGPRH